MVLNKAPNQPTVQINGPSSIDGELACQLESSADPDGDALNTTLEWIDPNQNVVPGTLEGNTYTLNNPNVEGSGHVVQPVPMDNTPLLVKNCSSHGNCATEMTDWSQISTSILEHVELLPPLPSTVLSLTWDEPTPEFYSTLDLSFWNAMDF